MTTGLLAELDGTLTPLLDVGLGYLTVDRPGASLSTGERQRIELASTVRAGATGMLYVLDEPSVGLHPANVQGLHKMIKALTGNGNSVIVVEHERDLIRSADWIIELGPAAGELGGMVVAQGTPHALEADPRSVIGPFLAGAKAVQGTRPARPADDRQVTLEIRDLYNLHGVTASFPIGRLTGVAGPSGAGKTALVLDSLIPAARAQLTGRRCPGTSAVWTWAVSGRSCRSTPRRSARTRGPRPRPTAGRSTGSARCSPSRPTPGGGAGSRAISLRIASRLHSSQRGALYVFDEPSTGLHPLDVRTLVAVFDRLIEAGATVIVIDHDLDLLAAADCLIDMGPGGGPEGGRIIAVGPPQHVAHAPSSVTGPWLAEYLTPPKSAPQPPPHP